MILLLLFLSAIVAASSAQSNLFGTKNVITVPPNCKPGQVWMNGECRDVWFLMQKFAPKPVMLPQIREDKEDRFTDTHDEIAHPNEDLYSPQNVVTVPPNCKPGQVWMNGECRDVWLLFQNMARKQVMVPEAVEDSKAVETNMDSVLINKLNLAVQKNIISVPPQCPKGFKPDALKICREIFD